MAPTAELTTLGGGGTHLTPARGDGMERYLKWLFFLALITGALALMSYMGARVTAGKILGPNPPLSSRTIEFVYQGVPNLPGRPRAWVFTYRSSRLPGVPTAQIFVSPTGDLIATLPYDLEQRIDAWERARLP